ncbi:MAG: prolyl oligopeptidase family serine peptidase [Colwellia sp.]|nr:prolyl oligopeptidase family serine peptidase [Colwellia sp.]
MLKFIFVLLTFNFWFSSNQVNASTTVNNAQCIEGKYALSPDGELVYRQCKDTNGSESAYPMSNPRPSKFGGEVFTTKGFGRLARLSSNSEKVAWSLDGKALYLANNLIQMWGVTQYQVDLLPQGTPISNLKPNFVTTQIDNNWSWVASSNVPVIDGLMSNLGIIPVIEIAALDNTKYVLTGGKNYQYDDQGERQIVVSNKKIVFEKMTGNDVKALKWINDPYGMPVLNLLYSATDKTLSVNVLEHSIWSQKFLPLARTLPNFKLNVDNFALFLTFAEKSITNSQNKVWYISNEKHNTSALYEFDLNSDSHRLLYHEAKFNISRPIYTRRGELLDIEIYREANCFVPLTPLGKGLAILISQQTPKEGLFDINILSIADNGSKVIYEIVGLSHKRAYLADLQANISTLIANNDSPIEYETVPVWSTTSDGGNILSYFSYTKNELFKQAPLMVEIHGGPHLRDKLALEAFSQEFLAAGYNVLRVNYRNSTGFGKNLITPNREGYQSRVALDVVESLKNTLHRQQLSPSKIIAFGGSFGGLLVTDITTSEDLHKNFTAFISLNGPHDYCKLEERPEMWGLGEWANCSDNTVKKYFSQRKILHNKPFIITYGPDDKIVLPKQSVDLLANFNEFNNVVGLKLPEERHSISIKYLSKIMDDL